MLRFFCLGLSSIVLGCDAGEPSGPAGSLSAVDDSASEDGSLVSVDAGGASPSSGEVQEHDLAASLCDGAFVSAEAVELLLDLTTLTESETIYTTYDRIDGIATLFEDCSDPWGMFPTTYRHITARIIQAIEDQEIEDGEWGEQIVLDFAGRYFENLEAALTGEEPSYGWAHYYYLADHPDVSRARAVVVAMVTHLTLDLPYALLAIGTTDAHEDDYFVLGELMIEITPDFIADLEHHYGADTEDLLSGFFLGDWVDGVYGDETTITLSYQTIRTKSWNNWRLINSGWGWLADGEIYTSFWGIDGVLATLDAAGTI